MDRDWEEGLLYFPILAARAWLPGRFLKSTGFSPNDLVFGHMVRGPLAILRDEWITDEPPPNLINYMNGFRHRLYMAGQLAKQKLVRSQARMKLFYDRRSEMRQFSEGSPFQAKFVGPYTVVRQLSEQNYLIETPDRRKRNQLCHINLLKPYVRASSQVCLAPQIPLHQKCPVLTACTVVQSAFSGGKM